MSERISHREHRETKPQREVVRAFMVQSAFHRDIASHVRKKIKAGEDSIDAIAGTSFMQVILMEKGPESTKNPGQLLPVGGNIDGKESPVQAIKREMQEETQLRAYKIQSIGDMTYTHELKKGDVQDVHAQYFIADIAPSDHAFALHPEQDKSRSFPHLTYHELVTLWSEGSVDHAGTKKPMLDSLWSTSVRNSSIVDTIPTKSTSEEEGKMWRMMREVAAHMEVREREKKTRVIEHMRALLQIKSSEKSAIDAQIQKKQILSTMDIDVLDGWYRETLALLQAYTRSDTEFVDIFLQATEMTNFEEEVVHAGASEQEAALRFMMTLLDLDFERDTYLELAKKSSVLAPLVEQIAAFGTRLQKAAGENDASTLSQQSMLEAFAGIDILEREVGIEDTETFLRDTFREVCMGSEYKDQPIDIGERLSHINTFLDEMYKEMQHFGSKDFSVSELSLYDEIRNADLTSLLQYAVPTPRAHEYFKVQQVSSEKKRGMVFEARRSIMLLMQFARYDAAYDATIERRNQPIQRIIAEAFPTSDKKVFVESWKSDEMLPNGMPGFRKRESATRNDVREDGQVEVKELRTCEDDSGQRYFMTTHDRMKSRSSFYRKILVRGAVRPEELTSDVYARSIVLSSGTNEYPYRSERIKRTLPSYPISDIHGEVPRDTVIKEFEDESAVFAVLDALVKSGADQGKEIRIIDFKPTPKPGQAIASSGAGGGAAIRLAKCYIEYISPKGVRTREEIQIFTPTLNPETKEVEIDAFAYEQQKKDDDHSYAVQRLLQTQGLRSVVELLWPYRIYGDIFRTMHNKETKQNAIVSRKKE
jgi:8-oxo-dGTP pyrophosphatase MutT (NUDIX family)